MACDDAVGCLDAVIQDVYKRQDDGRKIPEPYTAKVKTEKGDITTLVDIDFSEYRRKVDNRVIKKN